MTFLFLTILAPVFRSFLPAATGRLSYSFGIKESKRYYALKCCGTGVSSMLDVQTVGQPDQSGLPSALLKSGNSYRLVVAVAYRFGAIYIKFVGTHAQYDAIDADTVEME